MHLSQLHDFFDSHPGMREAIFTGKCHDCGAEVSVTIKLGELGFEISGGTLYQPFVADTERRFLKCDSCFDTDPHISHYQDCEVFVRCIGYLRPTSQMNEGKRAEVGDRKMFAIAP